MTCKIKLLVRVVMVLTLTIMKGSIPASRHTCQVPTISKGFCIVFIVISAATLVSYYGAILKIFRETKVKVN